MKATLKRLIVRHLPSEISTDVKEDADAGLSCLSIHNSSVNIRTNQNKGGNWIGQFIKGSILHPFEVFSLHFGHVQDILQKLCFATKRYI